MSLDVITTSHSIVNQKTQIQGIHTCIHLKNQTLTIIQMYNNVMDLYNSRHMHL